jgi:predicted TIM-barrel fold metal-dependent hydrolase
MKSQASPSSRVRSQLSHPVIDSDGHFLESVPTFLDYLRDEAGVAVANRFDTAWGSSHIANLTWYELSLQERRDRRAVRAPWWALPTRNTLDRATAMFPQLLYERLDEMGLDFSVLYPGLGLAAPALDDDEVRRASCRALNRLYADLFRDFARRLTPAAVIPMHTPDEAIAELDHAVNELGLKVVVMASYVKRPIKAVERNYPEAAPYAFWLDTYGVDSEYDYDPVWARCMALKVAPTFHTAGYGWAWRNSISNFMFNHLGHFAASAEGLCRSLFMGGVTRRFPQLAFAFLEGGVGWARSLLSDMAGHWDKRNPRALANYDPANLDREQLIALRQRYGGPLTRVEGIELWQGSRDDYRNLDEWAPCAVQRREDVRDLFVPHFFFGCEGDDPITASAFDAPRNPFGTRLKAIYGSDIGHWDVIDMREVTAEAHELVERGLMSDNDFRDFTFANPVELWTAVNPDFFTATAVESEVRRYLVEGRKIQVNR